MNKLKIKIGDLFKGLNFDNNNFESLQKYKKPIYIKNHKGDLVQISGFVKKNKLQMVKLITETGKTITCSTKHKFKLNDTDVYAIDATFIETIDGIEKIVKTHIISEMMYAYDISVPSPHYYQDAIGIIHHNTTVAKILAKHIAGENDYIYINASDERGMDVIRSKVQDFCSLASFSDVKIVILDEADGLTVDAQKILRAVTEQYAKSCRFILTANYSNKIIEPVRSRLQLFEFVEPPKTDVAKRCLYILKDKSIKTDENLKEYIKNIINDHYPDIRACINALQKSCNTGSFVYKTNNFTKDLADSLISFIKTKNLKDIREKILTKTNDYDELYNLLFQRVKDLTDKYEKIGDIILYLAQYQYQNVLHTNKELNFIACIIEILRALA